MNDPMYYSLKLMKLCGLHPKSKSKLLNLYFCINCCCLVFVLTLAVIGVMTTYDNNIFQAIECLQTVFLYIHLLGKYPNLFLKKATLARLLNQRSKFWLVDDFGKPIVERCNKFLGASKNFVRYFILITFLVIMNFFLQPILTGDLPVRVYIPDGWFHYINLTYWYLIPVIEGSIYGFDVIFCSICVPVIVQFRLLAYKIENWKLANVGTDQFRKELAIVVDHQNFLIEYCNEVNEYSTTTLLNQVVVSTAIICMQLFIAVQKEFLLSNKIKCLGYCTMEVIETFIYCYNAELVSDASENVGNAAYNSLWYETGDPDVRKAMKLIIERAQKKIVFNGLGLVLINLKTFTQIFKTAMSFFSYLNTMV